MKAILFDLDGVLVDSMPSHYKSWKAAFKEVSDIDVDERTIYLLEGMRGIDLVKKVLELKNYHIDDNNNNQQLADQVIERKNEVFSDKLQTSPPRAYEGVRELIANLDVNCKKAVVSGSAKKDVEILLGKALGKEKNLFDTLITAEDIEKGKPDPSSFRVALDKIKLSPSEALVVENAPLGVEAANKGEIDCIVVLNNTPLIIQDFKSVIDEDRILKETRSATTVMQDWCKDMAVNKNNYE
jgi:beta-phosphoglucomutase